MGMGWGRLRGSSPLVICFLASLAIGGGAAIKVLVSDVPRISIFRTSDEAAPLPALSKEEPPGKQATTCQRRPGVNESAGDAGISGQAPPGALILGAYGDLVKRAQLVILARRVAVLPARKYAWYRVEVLEVYKNASNGPDPKGLLDVATLHIPRHPGGAIPGGVPAGKSILFLVPYNEKRGGPPWKLLGGGAEEGARPAPRESGLQ